MLLQCVLLVAGFCMLIKGADWFVDGAAGIARRFGIPQLIIGLTIVSMGTSAPEAAVSISAVLKGSADITIGNVAGSNIMNVLVILGITGLITAVKVADSTIRYEIPFMVFVSILLMAFGYTGNMITFAEGCILWAAFLVYLGYLFVMAKKGVLDEEDGKPAPVWKLLLLTVIGVVLILLGSDITVDAATAIATALGMSTRFIGLTIVALGTSLPELVTSVTAAMKKQADIAIGNIVGSNIFNILFVVGTTALIRPIPFQPSFLVDMLVAVIAGVLLWLCVVRQKKLTRIGGIVFLVGYAAYFVYLMM
ncbi:MAG: calcium/sodium antiporter [Lachnospiraceae bacterium]|nr:calcium/sodium antiporter [Lachnospiraceae bacterium]